MKMPKLLFPTLLFIILLSGSTFAQIKSATENNAPGDGGGGGTSCSCTSPTAKCSASVSCGSGLAMCVCSDSGCTSYCSGGLWAELPDPKVLLLRLQSAKNNDLADVLTKAIGKKVTFVPYRENFIFDFSAQPESHWDLLEYLSQNGELKINGGDYIIWKKIREIVISGNASFCTGNATIGAFFNELTFFTGKKYQVSGSDLNSKMTIDIKGLTISEIIENLQKRYQITIQQ